jgi:uncharacterized protein YjiK
MKKWLFVQVLIFLALSCKKDSLEVENILTLDKTYDLEIPEMSGLAFQSGILYTVSDNTNKIYSLTVLGKKLSAFSFVGQDLEGIAINQNKDIYIVEERKREIKHLNSLGVLLRTIQVNVEQFDENSGLEGICINSQNNHIFVVNESSPTLLIELDENGNQLKAIKLNFSKDLSDICIDVENQELWILSDESKSINVCDLSGNLKKQYFTTINKMEGLAIDFNTQSLYIVSDSYNKLYKFVLK